MAQMKCTRSRRPSKPSENFSEGLEDLLMAWIKTGFKYASKKTHDFIGTPIRQLTPLKTIVKSVTVH